MVFSSLTFLYLFLPLSLFFYFITSNKKIQNMVLIIFSLLFYAWGEPVWISLLIFSSIVDYICGLVIEKNRGKWQSKAALISSVIINLSLLGFFKYFGFIVENINLIFNTSLVFKEYGLPIGISFYTFQTLSYTVDVYRGEANAQRSYLKFLLFVSLFHQLVAGPIVRYVDIANEIDNRQIKLEKFSQGVNRFVVGLGKKVIFANTAGEVSNFFLQGDFSNLSVLGAWFGIALFAIQIYYDFSGYSDMAIGLGHMFGFTYKENFNYPYISTSATEFWRRWHISLGSFFRDYVYIPLGGNKRLQIRNVLIVWALTGLWHGASWNFVLWGSYYGFLIAIEKLFLFKILDRIPKMFSHIYATGVMLIGWVLFYFTDLRMVVEYIKIMMGLTHNSFSSIDFVIHFNNNIIFFITAIILSTPLLKHLVQFMKDKFSKEIIIDSYETDTMTIVLNLCIIILTTSLLVGETYNPFLYFRF